MSEDDTPKDCVGTHCTPIKARMKFKVNCKAQLRSRVCRRESTNECSACDYLIYPVCSEKTGKDYFKQYFEDKHS